VEIKSEKAPDTYKLDGSKDISPCMRYHAGNNQELLFIVRNETILTGFEFQAISSCGFTYSQRLPNPSQAL
jgi:hypothetical protein